MFLFSDYNPKAIGEAVVTGGVTAMQAVGQLESPIPPLNFGTRKPVAGCFSAIEGGELVQN